MPSGSPAAPSGRGGLGLYEASANQAATGFDIFSTVTFTRSWIGAMASLAVLMDISESFVLGQRSVENGLRVSVLDVDDLVQGLAPSARYRP